MTLLGQAPLEVNIDELVQYWPYFYERSIGCVGVLKEWLVRSVHAALAEEERNLVLRRIQECALPLAQCESMALDATAEEQELHYTASQRHHLWKLLGMSDLSDITSAEKPLESVTPPTQQRAGEQHPVRHEVGVPESLDATGNCLYSGEEVENYRRRRRAVWRQKTPVSRMWSCLGGENEGWKGLLCKPYSSDKEAFKTANPLDESRCTLATHAGLALSWTMCQ